MAGEMTVVLGTPKTLEASGASVTNGAVVQADDATYDRSADGGGYPDAEFVLSLTFGTAPTEGTVVSLYARPLDIDGTNDAPAPEASRPTWFVGSFVVDNVTTIQYLGPLIGRDVPLLASYYLHNNGTGQTVSSGWALTVTPRTYKPAP